ncbi:transcriptional activator srcap [Penicillium maclennaniae]|uniref:transcriptional activator srcap n=1 Tax=Penicillium maclennaniae TaxID=1343394 RepID=UPI00253FC97B|nr:transcriptional activator srcap [Penicillium maclennaniae]KAJ5675307.1 transcriptional activator srcap [Penicillium maclennaniae]
MDQKTASAKSIAAPASIASAASADTPKQHILSVVTGRYAGSTHDVHCSETAIWVVRRGGFKFSVQSRFAVSSSKCNNDDSKPSPATNSIYSKPMHLTDSKTGTVDMYIASDLQVTIKQTGSVMSGWTYAPIIKKVPAGLWSPCEMSSSHLHDPKNDPSSGSDSSSPILNNTDKTIDLMMGLTLQAPPPTLSDDSIKDFNALESMSRDVFEEDEHPNVPSNVQTPSTAWLPAARSGTGSDPAQPWKDVQGTWASPKLSRVAIDSAVSAWANAFGYGSMSAAAPPRASTLADVEVDYMTAPFVSVAA